MLEAGKRAGKVHAELETAELELELARRKAKERLQDLKEERSRLGDILFSGYEPREVLVEAWADFSNGQMLEVRKDTEEVITQRPLREDERQGEFDLELWRADLHKRVKNEREATARRRAGDADGEEEAHP